MRPDTASTLNSRNPRERYGTRNGLTKSHSANKIGGPRPKMTTKPEPVIEQKSLSKPKTSIAKSVLLRWQKNSTDRMKMGTFEER